MVPKFEFNQLRPNNYVKCKISNDAAIYKVLSLDGWLHKVMLDGVRKGEWIDFEKIKPILLTQDKLRELGLVEDIYWKFPVPKNADRPIRKSGRWITGKNIMTDEKLEVPFLRLDGLCDIYYVHHLQNIYLDFTNTELTKS